MTGQDEARILRARQVGEDVRQSQAPADQAAPASASVVQLVLTGPSWPTGKATFSARLARVVGDQVEGKPLVVTPYGEPFTVRNITNGSIAPGTGQVGPSLVMLRINGERIIAL